MTIWILRSISLAISVVTLMLVESVSILLPASAYDVTDVQHGGTIEGTITLDGAVPEPKGFNLITFPDPAYCGRISN